MYKVLIVDDEDYFREGLHFIIPWQEYGVTIVAEASNGEEALTRIKSVKPHILFLDIQMPGLNGLEVLQQLQTIECPPKTIIISGYDDFSYVKQAMQYKVENYLLKPIQREELINTINQTIAKLEHDVFSQIKERQGFAIIKHNTLSRILNHAISSRELREKTEFLGIDIYGEQLYISVAYLQMPDLYNEHDCQLLNYAASNICEELLEGLNVIVFQDYDGRACVIWNSGDEHAPYTCEFIQERLNEAVSLIRNYLGVKTLFALSEETLNYKGLSEVYKEAVNVLEYRFLLHDRPILNVSELNKDRLNRTGFPVIEYNLIEAWLRSDKLEQVNHYIHNLFISLQQVNPSIDGAKTLLLELTVSIWNITRQWGKNLDSIKVQYEKVMQNLVVDELNLNKVKMDLDNFVIKINELFHSRKSPYSKLVNDVIQYVEKNLEKEISLKTLSQVIFANPAYLGRIFLLETGETFSDYLTKLRMEKAKALLLESHLKIVDISEMVGYSNPTYFHTVFKRIVGITPSELREQFKS